MAQGQHTCVSELPSLSDEFTYFLKTQGQNVCVSELPSPFDGFTYFLKMQEQDICISEFTIVIWWIHLPSEDTRAEYMYLC